MSTLNAILGAISNFIFLLVGWMPPMLSLILISGVVGVVFIVIFGKVSNQKGIKKAKDRVHSNLFLIRIYKDELGLTFKAMTKLLFFLIPYLGHQLIPLLILIVPFVLIAGQLNARYGYSPIDRGDDVVVKVRFQDGVDPAELDVQLGGSSGVQVETAPVRIPEEGEYAYRVRVDGEGPQTLNLTVDGETVEKQINTEAGVHPVSHIRSSGFLDLLLYPGEAGLPSDGKVQSIEIQTPIASMNLLGLETHWIIWFLIFTLVIGFALKGQLGVEI